MNLDFLIIRYGSEIEFGEIAKILLNDFALQNHESIFRITEIEFYWTTPENRDDSTYKRNHVNPKTGDWFFHYSGVDIALRNDEIDGFGGILIRGVYCIKENKSYKGPQVCAMKLFSGTSAFCESKQTKIIKHKFEKRQIAQGPRKGLGKNAVLSGTDKLRHSFWIKLSDEDFQK